MASNISLGRAVLVLATDLTEWVRDLGNADKHTKQLQGSVESLGKGLKGAGKDTKEFGTALMLSVSAPITAVVGGLAALAMNTAKAGDEIQEMAVEAGLGSDRWQQYAFALGQVARVNENELVKGFASLTDVIGQASAGSEKHIGLLQAMGFSQKEIAAGTITTEEAFGKLRLALQNAESPAQALAFAGDVLGQKVGVKLAGAIRESNDRIDEAIQKHEELGLGMSGEALDAASDFQDQIDEVTREFKALVREVGSEVMPIITDTLIPFLRETAVPVIRSVAEGVGKLIEWFGNLPRPVQEAAIVLGGLAAAAGPVLLVIGQLMTAAGTFVQAFGAVIPIVTKVGAVIGLLGTGPLVAIVAAIGAVVAAWYYWDEITTIVQNVYNAVKTYLVDKFNAVVNGVKAQVEKVVGFFGWMYDQVVGNSSVPDTIDGIGKHFDRLKKEMTDKAGKQTKATAEAFERLKDKVAEVEAGFFGLDKAIAQVDTRELDNMRLTVEYAETIRDLEPASHIANFGFKGLADELQNVGEKVQFNTEEMERLNATFGFTVPTLDMVATSTKSLGTHIEEFFTNIPKKLGAMQESLASTLTGLFGASEESLFGSVISGGLNFIFGPAAGLASKLVMQGMQKLGEVVWAGLKKIGGFFKDLFGGPSADELAGREIVEAFEDHLSEMLTETERMEAGNEQWRMTIIALRDKYISLGMTEADALHDAERLWASSKEGAEASRRIIEEIERKLAGGFRGHVTWTSDPFPTPPGTGEQVIPMARGGMGMVTRPTLFLAGEAGPEHFAFSRGGLRGGLMGGGEIALTLINQLNGREISRATDRIHLDNKMNYQRLGFSTT